MYIYNSGFQFLFQSLIAFPETLRLIREANGIDEYLTIQNFSIVTSFLSFSWTCQTLRYPIEAHFFLFFRSFLSHSLNIEAFVNILEEIYDEVFGDGDQEMKRIKVRTYVVCRPGYHNIWRVVLIKQIVNN